MLGADFHNATPGETEEDPQDMRFGEDEDWFKRAREEGLPVRRLNQISLIVRLRLWTLLSG